MDTPPLITADERKVTRPELALLGVVLAVAVTARLWNLSWGLPDVFEEATPFTVARTFWGNPGGHIAFNPDFFHYPALSFYIHFIGLGLRFLAGSVTGTYESLDAFRLAMATAPGDFIGGARFVSALFDAGTVYLVWSVTRAAFGRGTAAGAALLAAVNPLMIASAQGVNVDVILAFFLMLTLRQTLHLGRDDRPRAYILAGMMIGLTASVKYTGAVSLLIPAGFLAARFVSSREEQPGSIGTLLGRFLLIPAGAAVVFALLNPYILIDQAGFLRDFAYEQHHMTYGHLGLDANGGAAGFYFGNLLGGKFGAFFVAGVAAGMIVAFAGRNASGIGVTVMAALYVALISTWEMYAERYLLPAIPLLAILCAAGWVRGSAWAAGRMLGLPPAAGFRSIISRALPGAAIVAALIIPIRESAAYHRDLQKTDTRTIAREWIADNVAPGSVITSGPFGITFPPGRSVVFIPFAATGSEATAPFYDTRWYEDFDLLIASDYDYGRYIREPDRFGALLRFYDTLRSGWRLLAEFSPDSLHRGPTLWCYAPDKSRRVGRFEEDAIRRLGSIDNPELMVRFVRNLSGALFSRGRTAKCEQLLNLGIRLSPADPVLTQTMAFLLFREQRFSEALEYVRRAGGAGGESFEMLSLEANILIETGEPDRAEELLRRAAGLRPGSVLPYQLLIRIHSERGDRVGLIETLERYRAVIPPGGEESARIGQWLDSLRAGR